jgi:hypothetical protein
MYMLGWFLNLFDNLLLKKSKSKLLLRSMNVPTNSENSVSNPLQRPYSA